MAGSLEEIAYESSLRSLDRQEALVDELRARTGLLLAVSSVAASLGGRATLSSAPRIELILIAAAFVVSIGACLFILVPKSRSSRRTRPPRRRSSSRLSSCSRLWELT
jgi:hypothetical protein